MVLYTYIATYLLLMCIIIVKCKDTVTIIPNTMKNQYFHTVEGRDVTFSYQCTGNNVINWWGVGNCDISFYRDTINYDKGNSLVDCVNTLNLTLHDVTLNYPKSFTAYPSISERFRTTGTHVTAHLCKSYI